MKKIIEVSIGGINFTMEDDAYFRLREYLKRFEDTIPDKGEVKEVMEDVENRVAEIFQKEMKFSNQVVDMRLVQIVIDHLGEVDVKSENKEAYTYSQYGNTENGYQKGNKRFYRNMDEKMIAGVCSGLATYLEVDVTIIRVLLVIATLVYGVGLFAYIVVWIVSPRADSVARKLELRGFAPTAENIRKFTSEHK